MRIPSQRVINYLFPALVGLVLTYGYYHDAKQADITDTSSDQWNILPVCIKLDHPDLYEGDLFARDVRDVKYYTPLFVESIRFLTRFSDGDYVEGLNKLNFLINLVFSISWYLFFFSLTKNMPLALLMSLLVRGVLWMPGYELWGAGALWMALPRTAYIALLPFALLLFNPLVRSNAARYAGAFISGIITNFHPISGLGVSMVLLSSSFVADLLDRRGFRASVGRALLCGLLVGAGLIPYVYTYWTYVLGTKASDPELFTSLIPLRIGEQFHNPLVAVRKLLSGGGLP